MKWLLGCGTLFALALILFVVRAGLEGPVLVPISPGHGLSLVDVVALVPLLAGTGLLLGGLWQRRQRLDMALTRRPRGVRLLGRDPDIPTRLGGSTRGPCRPNVGRWDRVRSQRDRDRVDSIPTLTRYLAVVIGAWLQSPRSSLGVASGEMPASPGAITNNALLLLLLVLPGFFELLTQLEVLLGEECLAGCLGQSDCNRGRRANKAPLALAGPDQPPELEFP
jgi:hypothetical protein